MAWQITYITWIHLITSIISLQLVFSVYNMQQIRGRKPFLSMMALSAFWSLILTFESSAPTIAEKVTWSQFEYFANMGIPLMFLRFIFSHDLDPPGRLRKYFWILWVIPTVTILLVFTHFAHQLIWTGFSWSPAGHNILIYRHGPAFYVAMAWSVGMIFFANIILVRFILKRPGYYKSRAWFLLSGSFLALLTGMAYVVGFNPVEGLDISPMGTLVACFIFFWGISREQLFDIVPFSHQLMIEKMKDGVIILDNRNFITDISSAAVQALNADRGISGCKIEDVLPVLLPVVQGAATEQEMRKEICLEVPNTGWFEVTRYPLRGPRENFLGSLLILHDISHRKRSEMQLRKLAEELTDLNQMKDRIYSIIAHDLRNPFNSIMGFSRLLAGSYDEFSDSEKRIFAENIFSSSKNAYNLLENLLEWSLMQLGQFEFSPEELSLARLADESFALSKLMASEKSIELVNSIAPDQVVVADHNMVDTILRNLVSNAIKFTPSGGRIVVSACENDGMVEITVTDNGIGMPADVVAGLFRIDKLQSMPGTANEKGTGLGLLLTQDFVEKHGGKIRVDSEPGIGSRFIFTMPGRT